MQVAVIGLGFMGTTHLKAWRNVQGAHVIAVCSENPDKLTGNLSSVQGNLGGQGENFDFSHMGRYTRVSELLADSRVDAVDICLPTWLHAPVAIEALRAGKHVLVEKPMALNGEEAGEMIAESQKAGRQLMTGQVLRFLPPYRALADAIASGEHGAVRSAVLRRRCAAPFWNRWLGDAARSGGGVFDLLIHDIDFALHVFGRPDTVLATGYEDLPSGIDTMNASLLYPGGLSVLVTGGWHHPKAFPFSMDFTVVADRGTFEYSSAAGGGVTLYGSDGESRAMTLPEREGFEAELQYFADRCEDGQPMELCLPEESAAAVKLAAELVKARRRTAI